MHSKPSSEHHTNNSPGIFMRWPGAWKIAGRLALVAVLALAFIGYLTPDMRIQWANLMTLCGF